MPIHRGALAVAIGLATAACAADLLPVGTPHDATADFRPASMVANREVAAPGGIVELTYPDEMVRGILYVLEEEVGSTWAYRYGLISGGEDGGVSPEWFVPGDEDVAIPDIGVVGPGPDRVRIPEVAAPGSWRICTGNAGENICVRIEIVAP
jgi:hypothetical protein